MLPQTFEFKPAPVRRAVRVEVGETEAALRGHDGTEVSRLVFSSARSARFADIAARGMKSRWFDVHGEGGRFRLQCNSSWGDDPKKDGDLAQYHGAVRAVLAGLEAHAPHVGIDIGPGRGTRVAMFSIGLLALAVAVVVATSTVDTSDVATPRLLAAVLGLAGVMLVARFRPWGPRETMSAAELRAKLD